MQTLWILVPLAALCATIASNHVLLLALDETIIADERAANSIYVIEQSLAQEACEVFHVKLGPLKLLESRFLAECKP